LERDLPTVGGGGVLRTKNGTQNPTPGPFKPKNEFSMIENITGPGAPPPKKCRGWWVVW